MVAEDYYDTKIINFSFDVFTFFIVLMK